MGMTREDIETSERLRAAALSEGVELDDELYEFILAALDIIGEYNADSEIEITKEKISLCTKLKEDVDLRISVNNEDPDEIRLSAQVMLFTEKQAAILAKRIVEGTLINNYLGLEMTLPGDKAAIGYRHLAMNYTAYICTGQFDQALGELDFILLMFKEEINQVIRAVDGIMAGGRYKVALQETDAGRLVRVIKAVKESAGMTLRQAKEVIRKRRIIAVESYEEAVRIRDSIRAAGTMAEVIDTEEDMPVE